MVNYGQTYSRTLDDEFTTEWTNVLIDWNGSPTRESRILQSQNMYLQGSALTSKMTLK